MESLYRSVYWNRGSLLFRMRSEDDEAVPQPKSAKKSSTPTVSQPPTTQVKEEPPSPVQPAAASSKRLVPNVKQSPKTPVVEKSKKIIKQDFFDDLDDGNADDLFDEFDLMPNTRRSKRAASRSPSPSPGPSTRKSRHASKSPSPKPEPAAKKRRAASRSPSPGFGRSTRKSRHASKSPEPEPSTKKRRAASRSPSPAFGRSTKKSRHASKSPSPQPKSAAKNKRGARRSPSPTPKGNRSSSPDVPRRGTRARSRSPSPAPTRHKPATSPPTSPDIPRRHGRASRHSPSPVPESSGDDAKKLSSKSKTAARSVSPKPEPVTPVRVPKREQPSRLENDTSHCNGREVGLLIFVYISMALIQDCSNSSAKALQLLQCCAKSSIYTVQSYYNLVIKIQQTPHSSHVRARGCVFCEFTVLYRFYLGCYVACSIMLLALGLSGWRGIVVACVCPSVCLSINFTLSAR